MTFEKKPNTGTLFRNKKKREGKQDAEYTGSALVDGVEYFVDAWLNEIQTGEKKGEKYFKMQFKPKQRQQQSREASRQEQEPQYDDSDIPF